MRECIVRLSVPGTEDCKQILFPTSSRHSVVLQASINAFRLFHMHAGRKVCMLRGEVDKLLRFGQDWIKFLLLFELTVSCHLHFMYVSSRTISDYIF